MRKIYIFLSISGACLLILILLMSIALGLAMDSVSATSKPPKVDFVPMISGVRKLNSHMTKMMKYPRAKERKLSLTEAEFNAISDSFFGNTFAASLLGNSANIKIPKELLNTRLKIQDGIFILTYVYDTQKKTPFGRYVNILCRFDAQIEKGALQVKIVSCDAGSFPIPNALAQHYLNTFLKEKYSGSPLEKIITAGILRFKGEDGELILRYYPQELTDAADTAFFGAPNNKVRRFLTEYGKYTR